MASGKEVTSNIIEQALDALKLKDIEFSKNQKATIDVEQKKGYISENGEFSLEYEKILTNADDTFKQPTKFQHGLGRHSSKIALSRIKAPAMKLLHWTLKENLFWVDNIVIEGGSP